jgi:hypothetical protein
MKLNADRFKEPVKRSLSFTSGLWSNGLFDVLKTKCSQKIIVCRPCQFAMNPEKTSNSMAG